MSEKTVTLTITGSQGSGKTLTLNNIENMLVASKAAKINSIDWGKNKIEFVITDFKKFAEHGGIENVR